MLIDGADAVELKFGRSRRGLWRICDLIPGFAVATLPYESAWVRCLRRGKVSFIGLRMSIVKPVNGVVQSLSPLLSTSSAEAVWLMCKALL